MGKLVRLELFNFKSYKGKQVIEFGDSYFTSIIGPNGSGKSNSMDAISFVLGIKSSHLRSQHLKQLIYRGRKLTKVDTKGKEVEGEENSSDPMTASVMAVYIDDDGKEYQWKRSITAQAASEFRINGKQVTAHQYNAALEEQNILIKARNFLVFQGDVEAIASQSPKDLTRLIEQISGSLEYRAEYEKLKVDQEKAAEESNFNLNRRRGINAEIKQYQEQKREAEKYQTQTVERDEAIVKHILWKLYHFQQAMEQNKTEIEKYQEEIKEFRRSHEKYTELLEEAKQSQAKASKSVNKKERSIKKREKELEERVTSLVPVDEKIAITQNHLKKYATRIKEIKRDQDNQSATVESLKKELGVVQKAQAKFEKEQKKAAEETGVALSDADLAEYNKLKEQVSTRVAGEQIKVNNYSRQQKTDAETANSLKSKVENALWQVNKLEGEVTTLEEQREKVQSTVEQLSEELDEKKKEYNAITSERLRNAQKRTELEEKLHGCLLKLDEAADGRKESDREIRMKETTNALKRIFPGVKGRVSELCKPKLKKFGEAVSTVLGRHFDAVVCDNEKTAKDCIEYLRDQRAGQATFLPLDTIQVKPLNSNLKGMHRNMRMAIDTIDFDNSVERAMLYACGNAVVCDDLEVAKYVCYEKGLEVKAVTLDGTVIHKGGLMTGGRVGQGNARRWEDQEVEALKRLHHNLVAQIEGLPKSRRGGQEEALHSEFTGLEQRLNYSRDELRHVERQLDSKRKELTVGKKEVASLEPKLAVAQSSLKDLESKLAELENIVAESEDEIFGAFCKRLNFPDIRTYERRQGSLQQEAAQKRLEFTTQVSKIENQLAFETQRLKQTTERVASLEKLAERDEGLIEELEAEKAAIREELDNIEADLELMREDLENKKADLGKRMERTNELKREVSKRFSELEDTNRSIAQLESEIERHSTGRYGLLRRCKLEEIALPLTEASAKLDSLPIDETFGQDEEDPDAMDIDEPPSSAMPTKPKLTDYGIEVDFNEFDDELKEGGVDDETEEALLDKIRTLSSELERMAPNMKAIDRLEGVESRLQDTDKEFEASREASRRAKLAFQEVKEKRFALFSKAFTHISGQIADIYKDLTKSAAHKLGGTAYLDMEDSTEPYNEGIGYHAMPPGKRFRGMEHLSGGEKTMAALALLFAIHSYKASPFFVLDEVDAALDNANVQKISNYIRERAGPGFQFIVISLKTGLFQQSQALVGIYRDQKECSSKCLTLDLRKYVDA